MTHYTETEKRIIELIESENAEDVELGVVIAARELGKSGCLRLFGSWLGNHAMGRDDYYLRRGNRIYDGNGAIFIFNDFSMYVNRAVMIVPHEWGHDSSSRIIKDMRI